MEDVELLSVFTKLLVFFFFSIQRYFIKRVQLKEESLGCHKKISTGIQAVGIFPSSEDTNAHLAIL